VADLADLLPDGRIQQSSDLFDTPSAFALFSKRKLAPGRQSDDGWKSLRYRGRPLEHYKTQHLRTAQHGYFAAHSEGASWGCARDGLARPSRSRRSSIVGGVT